MIQTQATCFKCRERRDISFRAEDVKETSRGRAYVTVQCPQEGCGRSITRLVSKKNLTSEEKNGRSEKGSHVDTPDTN